MVLCAIDNAVLAIWYLALYISEPRDGCLHLYKYNKFTMLCMYTLSRSIRIRDMIGSMQVYKYLHQ